MSDHPELEPERWVDRHGDSLYRFALARLRRPELAAELVQETFLEALKARRSFSGRSTELTWLTAILRHRILDHYRREERRARGKTEAGPETGGARRPFDGRGERAEAPGRWGGDPQGDLERDEFWQVFRECLAELPEPLARIFVWREVDGLSGRELCEALDITPTNLWARLHRARVLLRESLERRWFGRADAGEPPRRGPSRRGGIPVRRR